MNTEQSANTFPTGSERNAEIQRVIKRLKVLIQEHITSAIELGINIDSDDVLAVIESLHEHAMGGLGLPVSGARDTIHSHVLNRLFEEIVEEPSNILFVKEGASSKEPHGYESMDIDFWIECLDHMKKELLEN